MLKYLTFIFSLVFHFRRKNKSYWFVISNFRVTLLFRVTTKANVTTLLRFTTLFRVTTLVRVTTLN